MFKLEKHVGFDPYRLQDKFKEKCKKCWSEAYSNESDCEKCEKDFYNDLTRLYERTLCLIEIYGRRGFRGKGWRKDSKDDFEKKAKKIIRR